MAADKFFRALLRLLPLDFRTDHGREMEQAFRAQRKDAQRVGAVTAFGRLWLEALADIFTTAPREHLAILRQDVAYALRALGRSPVFAAAAVLTMAAGIGAAVAVFGIVNAFMFRPLPVDRPEGLVSISTQDSHAPVPHGLSFLDLQDYASLSAVFTGLTGAAPRAGVIDAGQGARRVTLSLVTDNYFSLLGVQPAAGRLIEPGEGRARGDAPVIVLTHEFWQSTFAANPAIVGRPIRVNGRMLTVIGVTAQSFGGSDALVRADAYIPLWMLDDLVNQTGPSILEQRDSHSLTVLGRLKPGVTLEQARAAASTLAEGLSRQYPSTDKGMSLLVVPETHARPNPGLGPFFRIVATGMTVLGGALLLITCANVANLLLARAAGRGREVAVRSALGARRGRIMRQLLTEGIVLALLGTALAVPAAILALRSLEQFLAQLTSVANLHPDLTLDLRVVVVTIVVAVAAGIVAGMAPAVHALRSDFNSLLKAGGREYAGARSGRIRSALVVTQVAFSLTLLVVGGLFVRSLGSVRAIDLGFDTNNLVLASTAPDIQGYDASRRLALYENAQRRIAALPGVEGASWISWAPFAIIYRSATVSAEGATPRPDETAPTVFAASVSPEYFATARVPLVQGRPFVARDDARAPLVAIVNQALADRFWPDRDPIGRRLKVERTSEVLEVVGVVRNGRYNQVWESGRDMLFRPLPQEVPGSATIAVRTTGAPAAISAAIQEALRAVDPDAVAYDVKTMRQHLDTGNAFFPFRMGAAVTSIFGGAGIVLASIGLYGVVAFSVSQRTQEIGVRIALGARAADVMRDVLGRSARLAGAGLAIGLVLAVALASLARTMLIGVSPFDPVTYVGVGLALVGICLLAAFIPARRATAVDPLSALRAE